MVSGPVRCSFALRPACSLTRLTGLLHQGLRAFHCFHTRLGCYRLERKLPGGFTLPLEFCAFPRRTQTRSETNGDYQADPTLRIRIFVAQAAPPLENVGL